MVESGGKTILSAKRTGAVVGGAALVLALAMAWFGPSQDNTYYTRTSEAPTPRENNHHSEEPGVMAGLFDSGERKKEDEQRFEDQKRNRRVAIKYFAPQVIGVKGNRAIRMGAKLVGFLMSPIDTRSPSLVRVRLLRGGESGGVEIEAGSVLVGQYSYSGEGDRIFINFNRLDTPDGDLRQIRAQALDSGSYAPGISGEVVSSKGEKIAASLGLSMFAGMAETLTEKESLGFSQNGVQNKATMKNALLHGLSRASQDQLGRTASEIDAIKDYVVVPQGKEMIVELIEDFSK